MLSPTLVRVEVSFLDAVTCTLVRVEVSFLDAYLSTLVRVITLSKHNHLFSSHLSKSASHSRRGGTRPSCSWYIAGYTNNSITHPPHFPPHFPPPLLALGYRQAKGPLGFEDRNSFMVQGRDNFLHGVEVESSTVNATDGSTVIKTAHYTVVVPAAQKETPAAAAAATPQVTSITRGDGTTTTTFTLATPEQAELIGCQIEGSNPTFLRSGDTKSDASATMYLTLAPGTITGVAFAYQYVTGYKGTVGANFTLGIAGTAV